MFICSLLAVRRRERERLGSICQGGYFKELAHNYGAWETSEVRRAWQHPETWSLQGRTAFWSLNCAGQDDMLGHEVCRAGWHAGTWSLQGRATYWNLKSLIFSLPIKYLPVPAFNTPSILTLTRQLDNSSLAETESSLIRLSSFFLFFPCTLRSKFFLFFFFLDQFTLLELYPRFSVLFNFSTNDPYPHF